MKPLSRREVFGLTLLLVIAAVVIALSYWINRSTAEPIPAVEPLYQQLKGDTVVVYQKQDSSTKDTTSKKKSSRPASKKKPTPPSVPPRPSLEPIPTE